MLNRGFDTRAPNMGGKGRSVELPDDAARAVIAEQRRIYDGARSTVARCARSLRSAGC